MWLRQSPESVHKLRAGQRALQSIQRLLLQLFSSVFQREIKPPVSDINCNLPGNPIQQILLDCSENFLQHIIENIMAVHISELHNEQPSRLLLRYSSLSFSYLFGLLILIKFSGTADG